MKSGIATVQYNDLKGTSAIDFHGSMTELFELAKTLKLPSDYEIVGLSIYFGESGFEHISIDARFNNKIVRISTNLTWNEFKNIFKRLEVSLSLSESTGEDISEEINIDDII